jgi:hypothetical protein
MSTKAKFCVKGVAHEDAVVRKLEEVWTPAYWKEIDDAIFCQRFPAKPYSADFAHGDSYRNRLDDIAQRRPTISRG